jgi:hypothetical protein
MSSHIGKTSHLWPKPRPSWGLHHLALETQPCKPMCEKHSTNATSTRFMFQVSKQLPHGEHTLHNEFRSGHPPSMTSHKTSRCLNMNNYTTRCCCL